MKASTPQRPQERTEAIAFLRLCVMRVSAACGFACGVALLQLLLCLDLSAAESASPASTNAASIPAQPAARTRQLGEAEVKEMLTASLQERCIKDRGELELRFSRPWTAVTVPDEPLTLRLLEVPPSGITALNIVRFELLSGSNTVGNWQVVLQAKVWREIWVTRSPIRRGQTITEADFDRERRDILPCHEPLGDITSTTAAIEAGEGLQAGVPLLQRHLRLQPVVHRGQTAEALLKDGALNLTMKVEVLEDGAPGQIVRMRNPISRREMRGKVQNETTILVCL